ncbi:hypothetical protein VSP20_12280 [Myroides phaeus]|uniref:hypothetical protein n=1 Tax=Myroides phaeus TaxID=702745 RepID=UPI002DBA1E03|nr:hypothetical protein [Myroides phaeus]MEC4117740.1 hypothetical protein [Myroides phaeus]
MLKKIFPLALLFTSSMFGQVAKDTLWVDSFDYKVAKKEAKAFKLIKPIKGQELSIIETFDAKTKKIQTKGKGIVQDDSSILYSGNVENFSPQGKLEATYVYDNNGQLIKINSINQFTGEKYEGTFQDGSLYNGEVFQRWSNVFIKMKAVDGLFREYEIINPANAKNRQAFIFDEENVITEEQFYDVNGALTHSASYENGSPYNGTASAINYEKFGVKEINIYEDGNLVGNKSFYSTGQTKSEAVINSDLRVENFFAKNGQKLGEYKLRYSDAEYVGEQEGIIYYFNYNGNEDDIASAYHFENNTIRKVDEYYVNTKNNSLKAVTNYKEDGSIEKTVYYNENGTVKGQLTYDEYGYNPYEGLYVEDNATTLYKEGKIVERTSFYENGKVFEKRKGDTTVFYDKKGKELGRVTQGIDPYYELETYIDGSVYTLFDDEISQITSYKKGEMTYSATFDVENGKSVMLSETFYAFGSISKIVSYYPTGGKYKVSNYNTQAFSIEPATETYYDKAGKEIGAYNFDTKTGTYYEFSDKGVITQIAKFNAGTPVYSKKYAPVTRDMFETNPKYYLQSEIDYTKQGKFYDVKGKLVSTVTYKNNAPYNGTTYVIDEYTMTETVYKNGQKVGVESVYYYSYDSENEGNTIASKTYYENGEKVKIEEFLQGELQSSGEYKDDVLHGMYYSYDEEGNEVSRVQYSEGMPYQGVLTEQTWNAVTTSTYSNGELKEIIYNDPTTGVVLATDTYVNAETLNRTIADAEGNTVYKYTLKENNLDGLCQYFEKGKVKYKATFKEGILQEGTVAVQDLNYATDSYTYAEEAKDNFTVLDLKKNKLKVTIYKQESNEKIYDMEVKIKKADISVDPILSKKIDPTNLYPANELFSTATYW